VLPFKFGSGSPSSSTSLDRALLNPFSWTTRNKSRRSLRRAVDFTHPSLPILGTDKCGVLSLVVHEPSHVSRYITPYTHLPHASALSGFPQNYLPDLSNPAARYPIVSDTEGPSDPPSWASATASGTTPPLVMDYHHFLSSMAGVGGQPIVQHPDGSAALRQQMGMSMGGSPTIPSPYQTHGYFPGYSEPVMFNAPKAQKSRRRSAPGLDHIKHRRTRSGCYTCRSRRVKVTT